MLPGQCASKKKGSPRVSGRDNNRAGETRDNRPDPLPHAGLSISERLPVEEVHRKKKEEFKRIQNETDRPTGSVFMWRSAKIGLSVAIAGWLIIMGISYFATKIFLIPLAIILGLAIIPIFITSGYTHRA